MVSNYIDPGKAEKSQARALKTAIKTREDIESQAEDSSDHPTDMNAFVKNLNQKAKQDRIEPLIGRDEVLLEVIQVLSRRKKNNPLLIGEPGVGKTAIAEGLARMIVEKKVPHAIERSTIYALLAH